MSLSICFSVFLSVSSVHLQMIHEMAQLFVLTLTHLQVECYAVLGKCIVRLNAMFTCGVYVVFSAIIC